MPGTDSTPYDNVTDRQDVDFFREHAGYAYDPKIETADDGRLRGAINLARAEAYARHKGWEVVWSYDDEPCLGCDCGSPDCACSSGAEHETFGAILRDSAGVVLGSLWGICEPSREYRRVVNAELALEAMPDNAAEARIRELGVRS